MTDIDLTDRGSRESQKRTAYSIGAIDRAVAILDTFSDQSPALNLKQICEITGLPKTTAFRILSTLIDHDICHFDRNSGEYSLGFAVIRLADIRKNQSNWHSVVLTVIKNIRAALNETVAVSVREGDFRVHINAVDGLHPMRRHVSLGVRAPLYCSAASKVLLAGMDDGEIAGYFERTPLVAIQENTITDRDVLWQQIGRIREQGYAESQQEWLAGGASVAAPVRDFTGSTIAVIDILTIPQRYTPEHRDRYIAMLLSSTHAASRQLGYRS